MTGHYECHYGAAFVDRFYIMVRGQESQDIELDCSVIKGNGANWFYAKNNNANDWTNYEYIGYLTNKARECKKDLTVPCYSADRTQLHLPMCACAERPTTETFICGLKKVGPDILFDPTCWHTMITVKYRYIEDPTTLPLPTTDVTTSGGTLTPAFLTTTKTPPPLSTTPPPPTTNNPTTNKPTNSSVTVGLVVGVAIAAVILVVVLVALCFSRRRRLSVWIRRRKPTAAAATTSGDDLTDNDVYRRNVSMSRILPAAESRRPPIVVEGVKINASCEIAKGNVTLMRALGEGCFGLVMEGIATNVKGVTGSMQVAVKVPKAKDRKSVQDLASEVTVWQRIGEHKNVISLVGVTSFQNPAGTMLWVLMEYADHGCLSDYMRAKRFGGKNADVDVTSYVPPDEQNVLSSRDMFRYALDVARGMEHLTMRECIHRDLAARNVLVCNGEVLKISDFGMAKDIHYFDYYRKRTPKNLVPYKWTAPEALLHRVFTEASDVWSFGVLLWEIATLGSAPYPGVPAENLYDLLTKDGYRMRKPRTCSRKFYDLMLKCWALNPIERPKFYELVTILEKALAQAENWEKDVEEANDSGDEMGGLDVSIPTKRLLSAQDSGMPGTPTTPGSYSCFESRRDERAESTSL
ncbi:fibroblast growth factor receptor 3-like isoform X2 [Oscarella lobularis]